MLDWFKQKSPRWKALVLLLIVCTIEFFILHYTPPSHFLSAEPKLGVNDVVTELKAELEQMETQREASGAHPLFALHDFDIELAFVVTQDVTQHGKIEYQVVTAEMERKIGLESTHKLVLHMQLAPPLPLRSIPPTKGLSPEGAIQLP